MDLTDYYGDRKWCEACAAYVHYLASLEHQYCAQCGAQVRLWSHADEAQFRASLAPRKRRRLTFGSWTKSKQLQAQHQAQHQAQPQPKPLAAVPAAVPMQAMQALPMVPAPDRVESIEAVAPLPPLTPAEPSVLQVLRTPLPLVIDSRPPVPPTGHSASHSA
jgi:hypothetical protein